MASEVFRDAHGIPHLRADSVAELARLQGEVTARDRAWQLEFLRRRATGTAAAVLGPALVDHDVLVRRCRIAETAKRALGAVGIETYGFVAAYVDGVNAGLQRATSSELERLGIEPEPWQEWTPLAVFAAQHLLFAGLGTKLFNHHARQLLGDDARLLSHEGPLTSGSNVFAVGGARTASGQPIVAGDPHRIIEAPGVYQQVRLACTDPDDSFDVVGLAFPGVPGVPHFGHAGDVVWAITNGMADYQDVYAERFRESPDAAGEVEAEGPHGWEPAERHPETVEVAGGDPVRIEVLRTRRGPVFSGGTDTGHGLALRSPSLVVGELGFDALLPLLRARRVADVDQAQERWVEPVNNVVIADVHGGFRYRVAGLVPTRSEGNRLGIVDAADPETAWRGWHGPLPRRDLPPTAQITNGNERRGPESDPIGVDFAPRHRADRLAGLLRGRNGLTAEDLAGCHADARMPLLDPVQQLLVGLRPGPEGERVRREILDWDGEMLPGSAGAAAYATWRHALTLRIAAEPVLAPLVDLPAGFGLPATLAPWLALTPRVGLALGGLLTTERPFGIDLPALATAALDDAAGHPGHWGSTHRLQPVHAFEVAGRDDVRDLLGLDPVPVGGDVDCVRCTGSMIGVTDLSWRGSVARYVWDLADRSGSGWVVPLGAHGDVRHRHHHDQLAAWTDVELFGVVTDWHALTPDPDLDGAPLRMERFDPERDAEMLHSWVTQERARFWMMQDHSVAEVREIYAWLDEQPTHHVWLVKDGPEPVALFQDYQPTAEEVGEKYDVEPGDLGIHIMLAPPSSQQRGFSARVLRFVLAHAFADPAVQRLVGEPDARNDKVLNLTRRMGFEDGPRIRLSTKPAQMVFLSRERWRQLYGA